MRAMHGARDMGADLGVRAAAPTFPPCWPQIALSMRGAAAKDRGEEVALPAQRVGGVMGRGGGGGRAGPGGGRGGPGGGRGGGRGGRW
jgi:hypothetical protein